MSRTKMERVETGFEERVSACMPLLYRNMNSLHSFLQNIATGSPDELTIETCRELLSGDVEEVECKLRVMKNRAMAVVGMASLYAASGGVSTEQNTKLREASLQKLEEASSLPTLETCFLEVLCSYAAHVRDQGSFGRLRGRQKRIVDYVIAHVNEPLSLKEAAKDLGEDPDHMSRELRKATGYSFPQLVTRTKITKAKGLLRATERSVTEIAYQLSFSSPGQFTTVFRRETGVSPREYRAIIEKP